MIENLSPRERTIVLAGGAVIVVVLAWLFVITPLLDRSSATRDLVPERESALTRRLDLLARRNQITAELEAANARIDHLAARLLTAAAPAVAASELQKLVKDMAAEAATEIRSERILPPEERGELLEIPVEIAVSAEIRQLVDLLARETLALQPDDIQSAKIGAVADGHAERNEIGGNARHTADEGIGPDPHELMHGGQTADDRALADGDVAAQGRAVDQSDVVADLAIMGDMGGDH